jgi:hypothetical protein
MTVEWECPACGYTPTSEDERQRHEEGVDEKHLACAHQDIEAIKARQLPGRGSQLGRQNFLGRAWG